MYVQRIFTAGGLCFWLRLEGCTGWKKPPRYLPKTHVLGRSVPGPVDSAGTHLARRASFSLMGPALAAHIDSPHRTICSPLGRVLFCLVYTPCRTLQVSRGCPPQVNVLFRRICLRQDEHMQITSP